YAVPLHARRAGCRSPGYAGAHALCALGQRADSDLDRTGSVAGPADAPLPGRLIAQPLLKGRLIQRLIEPVPLALVTPGSAQQLVLRLTRDALCRDPQAQ